ncbi:MAG: bifunctional precorrin-2 dehydrogenase/sirohydrochlorin ferrochelatase [Oscillospiraceae bacterium]|nr:bifunctional precorrin-2 dehydrogenase/sirohydrochlorin ferrochelatase [Oscillospiraceae bacterium]
MAYFPFFVDLASRRGLVVGGGKTALGKVRRLLEFGPALTVIAPEVLDELTQTEGIQILRRPFRPEDIGEQFDFVIAATDDPELNRRISALCRQRRIPVNVVDTAEECSFLFPALVRRGPLVVGISTSGCSPTAARDLRDRIGNLLPDQLGEILEWLGELRAVVREKVGDEAERREVYEALYLSAMEKGRILSPEETESLLPLKKEESSP